MRGSIPQNNVNGITSTLTGSAGQAVLGKALSGGMNETADWVRQRYGQTFDAIYVPRGKRWRYILPDNWLLIMKSKAAVCVMTSPCRVKQTTTGLD